MLSHFNSNILLLIVFVELHPTILRGQEILLFNNNFLSIENQSDFQSIELIKSFSDSEIWLGFDDGDTGSVYKYLFRNENDSTYLILKDKIILPSDLNHPNDLQIYNDSLFVTGWNNTNKAIIGLYHKNELHHYYTMVLDDGWHLQFSFFYNSQLFLGIVNNTEVILKPFKNLNNSYFIKLFPSPMISSNNYINGSLVISNWLILLTSFPNRLYFYDINNFSFLFYIDLYNIDFESEGITGYKKDNNQLVLYVGFRVPNRIAKIIIKLYTENVASSLIKNDMQFQLVAFPNPFTDSIRIQIVSPFDQTVSLDLFNILGQKVKSPINCNLKGGLNIFKMDLSNLLAGSYYLLIRNGATINKSYKIIKTN